jgi:hypothetical protein
LHGAIKIAPVYTMKVYTWNGGLAPLGVKLVLDEFLVPAAFPRKTTTVHIEQEARWAPSLLTL